MLTLVQLKQPYISNYNKEDSNRTSARYQLVDTPNWKQ